MQLDPLLITALIIGLVLPALLAMGVFATKADLERLRADIATALSNYVLKQELEHRLSRIESLIDRLIDLMENKK